MIVLEAEHTHNPVSHFNSIIILTSSTEKIQSRSLWSLDLRHEPSSPARTLGSSARIPLKAWMSVCVYSVCVVLCIGSGLTMG
jgi:hypothetical protein